MKPIRFGWRDIPGFLFAAIIAVGGLYVAFKYPNWHSPRASVQNGSALPQEKPVPVFVSRSRQQIPLNRNRPPQLAASSSSALALFHPP